LTLPFRQIPLPPKRPVYPSCANASAGRPSYATHTLRRAGAIARKLVSRPVEFCLPPCHARHGEFSNDARRKCCRRPVSRALGYNSPGGEEKANRNTCQFRNRYNPLTTYDITFSNRNTILCFRNHRRCCRQQSVSEDRTTACAGFFAQSAPCAVDACTWVWGSRATNHDSRFTTHGSRVTTHNSRFTSHNPRRGTSSAQNEKTTLRSSAARFPVAPGISPSCPCTRPRTAHPTRRKPPEPIPRSHKSSPAAAWCC